jgi:glycerol-3-phosphate dehydrogenase (NAD(P)+)
MGERIAVLGGGSWGATLSTLLARNGHDVALWEFAREAAERLQSSRRLPSLPQLELHPSVRVTSDLADALKGRGVLVGAVPSEHVRSTFRAAQKSGAVAAGAWAVSVTKGLEKDTFRRMSEIAEEEVAALRGRVAVLSGPSHAEEVAGGIPTAVVSAGPAGLPDRVRELFNTDSFRVYTSDDAPGVELGGAVKNIYAVACGISDGLGLGDNTKAALMTRGLNEMIRFGIDMGAKAITFFGLSGVGDLIVTCGSRHSRNRLLGEKIGRGKTLEQALGEMTMVAEGVPATYSVHQLGLQRKIDLPIVGEVYRCLYEGKSAKACVQDLLTRPPIGEMSRVEHLF